MGSPPVFIKDEEKEKFEAMGWYVYWQPSRLNLRTPSPCDLPYVEFMDGDRLHRRIDGIWEVELRSSGMPPRGPDYKPSFWKLTNSCISTLFLDFRAEVLAGNPIPSAVVEHPYLTFYDSYWPQESKRIYASVYIKGFHHYFKREDGEYVKEGLEYVFKPHVARTLTIAKPKPKPAVVLREDDDEEPDLFKPRAAYIRED